MKVAVVTTSINAAPVALRRWSALPEVIAVVVAGDRKTPAELGDYVRSLPNGVYLDTASQYGYTISSHVPWNCIQRRNFALLHALTIPDVTHVALVDDDNAPLASSYYEDAWMQAVGSVFRTPPLSASPSSGTWFDPGTLSISRSSVPVFARGLPYDVDREAARRVDVGPLVDAHVGVFQASVVGDPDVDAIQRMHNAPDVVRVGHTITLPPRFYAPINSQATVWRRDYAPLAAVPPYLGRMDDIWGGLIAQRIMRERNACVAFGRPAVYQDRNPHNLVDDLEKEILGYRYTGHFAKTLDAIDLEDPIRYGLMTAYRWIAFDLGSITLDHADKQTQPHYLSPMVTKFMKAWADDVDRHALVPTWLNLSTEGEHWRNDEA